MLASIVIEDVTVLDGRTATLKGNRVRFQLSDVFLPSPEELRAAFPNAEELEGTVVAFSDSGNQIDAFAVIEVVHKQTLVVPVERLEMTGRGEVQLGRNPNPKDSASETKFKTE